jgi:hypothetical protein
MGATVGEVRRPAMSTAAVVGWVCGGLFVVSLYSGATGGPLFWLGLVSLEVLVITWVFVLVRWMTRRIDRQLG